MSELFQLIETLRAGPERSRNRNYEELSAPLATQARRVLRRLDGIARDLRSGAEARVVPHEGGVAIMLAWHAVRARRVAYLTPEEHAFLCADPEIAHRIARAQGATAPGP